MNDPAASSGVSSSLLSRHSVLDLACPVPDTGESSRVFWIPAFAGMTNSPQAAGNTTLREFKKPLKRSDIKMLRIILDIFFQQAIVKPKSSPVRLVFTGPLRVTIRGFFLESSRDLALPRALWLPCQRPAVPFRCLSEPMNYNN